MDTPAISTWIGIAFNTASDPNNLLMVFFFKHKFLSILETNSSF